jgi:hypothetical protein
MEEIGQLYPSAVGQTDCRSFRPRKRGWRGCFQGTIRETTGSGGRSSRCQGEATVEKIAINAVMAGCTPEAMPVIITALEAMLEEEFNLYGIQATTHPVAPR